MRYLTVLLLLSGLIRSSFLFRREKKPDQRWLAYDELFAGLATIYELASNLKPGWQQRWITRDTDPLPPKYDLEFFEYKDVLQAVFNMRFAARLLQQNRWKSKVCPLFDEVDEQAWQQLWGTVNHFSMRLISIQQNYQEYLRADESEWISQAVEQFDELRYRHRQNERTNIPINQLVAETTYGSLYTSMTLSEKLINRLRFDATGEAV